MVSGSHFAVDFPSCSRILSACAEDRGLCPWMNAQNVAKYFSTEVLLLRRISPSADNPPKPWRRRVCNGGTTPACRNACLPEAGTSACRHGLYPWGFMCENQGLTIQTLSIVMVGFFLEVVIFNSLPLMQPFKC